MKRGEIYYIESTYRETGSEQRGGRPAVIVSNDKNNENSEVVEVVYMTTKPKNDLPTHVFIRSALSPSTVLCEQVNSVSVKRIGTLIGKLTKSELAAVDSALAISLGIDFMDPKPAAKEAEHLLEEISKQPLRIVQQDPDVEKIKLETERDLYRNLYNELLSKNHERSKRMRKKLVYICSPCRGDIEKNIEKAQRYCREAVELWDDVIPIAPHVYFTQFLDDTKQEERAAGMDMGLSLLAMCDELWVYGIENPSEGMRSEIEYAKQHQIPIRDAAELYRNREVETLPIGDALIVLPSHVGNLNGVAAIESTTVRINGEMILDLAIELRRHPGHDITLEADKGADSEVDQ